MKMASLKSASYTYGRVSVVACLPQRKIEYFRKCHNIIITADMACDDDQYPVYYLKATYTTRPSFQSHKLEHICTWNVTNSTITVSQMRQLIIDMLPLVAALKHYSHFTHSDSSKLVNAAHAVNACVIRHMSASYAA